MCTQTKRTLAATRRRQYYNHAHTHTIVKLKNKTDRGLTKLLSPCGRSNCFAHTHKHSHISFCSRRKARRWFVPKPPQPPPPPPQQAVRYLMIAQFTQYTARSRSSTACSSCSPGANNDNRQLGRIYNKLTLLFVYARGVHKGRMFCQHLRGITPSVTESSQCAHR